MEILKILLYLAGLALLIILCFNTGDGILNKVIKFVTILYLFPLVFFLFLMYEILFNSDD